MSRPIRFEIHAESPERAIDFYETALGWSFTRLGEHEYWLIETGPAGKHGIDGGLIRRKGPPPPPDTPVPVIGYVCSVEVHDLETMTHAVTNAGGTIVAAKRPIPGVGWVVYAKDTEGNVFGLHQPDANAS